MDEGSDGHVAADFIRQRYILLGIVLVEDANLCFLGMELYLDGPADYVLCAGRCERLRRPLLRTIAFRADLSASCLRATSAATVAETSRAIIRARLTGRITAQQERAAMGALRRFARRCHLVSVTEAILAHAGRRFPVEPIRILDAIHLATAEALGGPPTLLTIITRDASVRDNATALGYPDE